MRLPFLSSVLGHDTLLRRLLALYTAGILAIMAGSAAVISLAVWPHYEQLERRESNDRLQAVLQAIQSEQDRLQDLANTNAVWDDAFNFVHNRNPKFPAVNFSPDALGQIGVDAAIVLRNDGAMLFRGGRGDFGALANAMLKASSDAPGFHLAGKDSRTSLITIGNDVALISERRIVRADGSGPSEGVLLFARRIGPDVLSRMHTLTGETFHISAQSAPAIKAGAVRAETALADAYGADSARVTVMGAHDILLVGKNTIRTLAISAAIMLTVLGAAFAAALVFAVVAPVKALRRAVTAASETQAPCESPSGAPREISDLAAAFDDALQLAIGQTKLRDAALAETQLAQKANEAKSAFIASVSHELRTPLNAVIGYGEMMQETATEDGRTQDASDAVRIVRAARSLLVLINNILDFSKLGAGKMTADPQVFDVQSTLQAVHEIGAPIAAAKGLRIDLIAPGGLGQMHSDEQKLKQCLINLMSNAIKFTARGGVELRAIRFNRDGAEIIQFAVIDSGIGMEADALERIFDPFSQADDTIASRFGGTGLGLAITREMVQLLGGDINVSSKPGVGTTFVINAPAMLAVSVRTETEAARDAA